MKTSLALMSVTAVLGGLAGISTGFYIGYDRGSQETQTRSKKAYDEMLTEIVLDASISAKKTSPNSFEVTYPNVEGMIPQEKFYPFYIEMFERAHPEFKVKTVLDSNTDPKMISGLGSTVIGNNQLIFISATNSVHV